MHSTERAFIGSFTVVDCLFSNLDKLVMILAILTGVFGAVGVILLVVLIVICHKLPRRRRKELEL